LDLKNRDVGFSQNSRFRVRARVSCENRDQALLDHGIVVCSIINEKRYLSLAYCFVVGRTVVKTDSIVLV
jgi:hypothetical protein